MFFKGQIVKRVLSHLSAADYNHVNLEEMSKRRGCEGQYRYGEFQKKDGTWFIGDTNLGVEVSPRQTAQVIVWKGLDQTFWDRMQERYDERRELIAAVSG